MFIYMMMIDSPEDRSKFEIVYQKYRGLMFYVADQILHNTQDSEDAVHQAFVKIAENIEKIGAPECPKTKNYVVTIAESKAIDLYRSNKRRNTVEYTEEMADIAVEDCEQKGLAQCILRLPVRYREIVLLKYYHGFSLKEIAKQLGISLANANKIDQRAKKKLMELCKEEGVL